MVCGQGQRARRHVTHVQRIVSRWSVKSQVCRFTFCFTFCRLSWCKFIVFFFSSSLQSKPADKERRRAWVRDWFGCMVVVGRLLLELRFLPQSHGSSPQPCSRLILRGVELPWFQGSGVAKPRTPLAAEAHLKVGQANSCQGKEGPPEL